MLNVTAMKFAAMFGIFATALWTIRLAIAFLNNLSGVSGGIVADNALLTSTVDLLAGLSLLVFFVAYYRTQE